MMGREHVHLIGIGGTGMTALAGLLHESGCRVTGSDAALYPPTSTILREMGLQVSVGFDAANLDPVPDLVVVGNAVRRGNPEAEEVLDRRLPHASMPQVIAERFLAGRHSMVVAGTHGKTTTCSMLAWVLDNAGHAPGFLIGGLPANFDRPFRIGSGAPFVIEGDEYDTAFFDKGPKFMHYLPDTAILGAVEFDHADIYRDLDQVREVFRRFVNIVPRRGLILRNEDSESAVDVTAGALSRVEGFGLHEGEWRAIDVRETPAGTTFRILRDGKEFLTATLGLAGEHNALNALAVTAAAHEIGVPARDIAEGLNRFRGVARRLQLRGRAAGVTVLDDFAHHPTAIAASVKAVRHRYPGRRVWAILEPRSWSLRRRVFQERLASSFGGADEVVIAAVFHADDIAEDDRLDPGRLAEQLNRQDRPAAYIPRVEEIVEQVAARAADGDVVLVMSNGGFDGLHDRLLEALSRREDR